MEPQELVAQLENSRKFFARSSNCFTEEDSNYAPGEGMMTVAQHLAHMAQSVDWFVEGAFRPEGLDLDFSKFETAIADATSLTAAHAWFDRAYDAAIEAFGGCSREELAVTLPEGPVMSGWSRTAVGLGILEHTAHHRGSLAVYARNLGRKPLEPYGG